MKKEFISYPKSGRTWIRYILHQLDPENKIRFHHSNYEFNDGSKKNQHLNINDLRDKYSINDKITYLERDPRDVMVSLYCQITGRFNDFYKYKGLISDFIRDDYFGAHNLKNFRCQWNQIVLERGYLKISYEDCHEDMEKVILNILSYYEVHAEKTKIREAIHNAKFKNMKEIELGNKFSKPWLQPRLGKLKVRRGLVHGYKDSLNQKDIIYLNSVFKISQE